MSIRAQSVSYRTQNDTLLSAISVTVDAGEITSIIGPGRPNKTALMRCLSGQNQPTSGNVCLSATTKHPSPGSKQTHRIFAKASCRPPVDQLTVHEFVQSKRVTLAPLQTSVNGLRDRLFELYHDFDLFNLLNRKLHQLSVGESRRARLTQALYQTWLLAHAGRQGVYLLLDETLNRLGFMHELKLLSYARELSQRGVGVGIVLDDLNHAARFSDKLILLNRNRLAASGSTTCVLKSTILSRVYQHPISVKYHKCLQRLMIQVHPAEHSHY